MRLKRNTTPDGMCKYSLIEHEKGDRIEHGLPGTENEFFVIKLKDMHARAALEAYANSIKHDDPEFASEVRSLAMRSGANHPNCKQPD